MVFVAVWIYPIYFKMIRSRVIWTLSLSLLDIVCTGG